MYKKFVEVSGAAAFQVSLKIVIYSAVEFILNSTHQWQFLASTNF